VKPRLASAGVSTWGLGPSSSSGGATRSRYGDRSSGGAPAPPLGRFLGGDVSGGFGSRARSRRPKGRRAGGQGRRSARAHAGLGPRIQDGDRTVPWSCSRVESVAEVGEGRPSSPRGLGSSVVDGRRPGTAKTVAFDEAAAEPGLLPRGEGDAAAMLDPPRGTRRTSEVVSQARRAVENAAGGRGSAEEPSIGAPPGSRSVTSGIPSGIEGGCGRAEAGASPSSEAPPGWLIRYADRRGSRTSSPRPWPRVSRRRGREAPRGAARTEAQPGTHEPQGARGESQLQKSVRRIFPAANVAPSRRRRGAAGTWDGSRRPPTVDAEGRARGEREGAGRGDAREQQCGAEPAGRVVERGPGPVRLQDLARADGRRSGPAFGRPPKQRAIGAGLARWRPKGRDAPRKGGVAVRGPPTGAGSGAGRSPRPRVHRATESVRASLVRSGFLSRWAQEVGGQRWVPPGIPVPRRNHSGSKPPRSTAVVLGDGIRTARTVRPSP